MRTRSAVLMLTLVLFGCTQQKPAPPAPAAPAPAAARPDREKFGALKELLREPDAPPQAPPPAGPLPVAGGPVTVADVTFRPPESWRFTHPTSQMRQAQWEIPGPGGPGESVVYFFGRGQGGGVEENVNMWYSQVAVADGAGPGARSRGSLDRGGVKLTVVRVTGTYQSQSMGGAAKTIPGTSLVGIMMESAGGPVFIKITGPAATIAAADPGIQALLDSIRLAGGSAM